MYYSVLKGSERMDTFTAHLRENNGKIEMQTVSGHCEGVARYGEIYGRGIQVSHMAGLQGLIHDMGKLCADFNEYIHGRNDIRRGMIDHCYAGARYLMEFAKSTRDPQIIETAAFVARTVISHHGLHDWLDENGEDYFERRIGKEERYAEIKANIHNRYPEEALLKLLLEAKEEYAQIRGKIRQLSGKDRASFAFYMGQFERLMQSILVDADRTDTADFQLGSVTEKQFDCGIWQKFYENIEGKCAEFAKKTDPISKLRRNISERCREFANHEVGICRLIVPTGGGKTLSSLRFAIHYCRKYGKDRIFYIAPYRSILEQNSDVLKAIIGEEYFLEHHSDIAAGMEDEGELAEYELRSDKWDVPVIATTFVQFLNTLFSDRMDSVRRMHRLGNSVIIMDEVQSVPIKCVSLFNLGMNFLSKICGSCIVLCSATQPVFEKTKYSMRIDDESSMTGDYSGDFLAFKRNEIIARIRRGGYTYEEAAEFCMERYREEGSILFVVNTKTAAFRIYQELKERLKEEAKIVHISTNMCPEGRRKVINDLTEMLKHHEKVLCVTTQLIEAGIDISFPCAIRSLAGMDNFVQAAGRCNRSNEYGKCCNVYLLNLREERLGNLKEIKIAQAVSRQMIENGRYEDFSCARTLRDYFEKYYEEQKEELEYNVEDMGVLTDLVDLLSLDKHRHSPKTEHGGKFYTGQAFKTAGQKFRVIDDVSVSVVVPYNEEAKTLIQQLRSGIKHYEVVQVLRKTQKYTVGIFEYMEKKLEERNALELLDCGVYVLDERFYDEELGVVLDGKPMDLLMY